MTNVSFTLSCDPLPFVVPWQLESPPQLRYSSKRSKSMTDQDQNNDKKEMRMMWILTAVVVLAILGIMGLNMLTNPDWRHGYRSGATTEVTK